MTTSVSYALAIALAAAILAVSDFAVAAPDTETPLKGLTSAPVMQFPLAGTSCYGLAPLAAELRLNSDTLNILASVGFTMPVPKPLQGPTTTLGTVQEPYIKISDNLLKVNEVNCLDKVAITLEYPLNVKLDHSGQMFLARIPLWASETIIIGAGREDYLGRREAAISQMFTLLAPEWKRQNGK